MSNNLRGRIAQAVERAGNLEPMRAAFRSVIEKQADNLDRMGNLEARLERLKEVRESSVGNRKLFDRAIANLETNKFRVRSAADSRQAVEIVLEEMGAEKLLVKSKSNLSREIGLAQALGAGGVEVIETDIGDRVNQIAGEPAVHPTGPCAHLDRYRIAEIVSSHLGREIQPEPRALIEAVRGDVLPYIEKARIGLTGVNAIGADEGALLWCHNEGNLDLVSQRPDKLIVLACPEKIYPNLAEALNMVELETYYATGQPITSFVRIVGGPSKTADIEKELYYGVHGPAEIVVVVIDNGRWEMLGDERLREAMLCIGCGACILECPAYDIVGPEYGSQGLLGGRGVCALSGVGGLESAVDSGLPLCTTCRSCAESCPISIETPDLIEELRARATVAGILPLEEHVPMIAGIRNYGNPWMQPRRGRASWTRGLDVLNVADADVGFFAGCSLAYLAPDTARAAVVALRAAGMTPVALGIDEVCCGSPLLRVGQRDMFLEMARENISRFEAAGLQKIVAACPGCLKALREYSEYFPEFDIEVAHISEVLADAITGGRLKLSAPESVTVTYHDPCHLGRGCGIYDEPRRVIEAIEGVTLNEMERSREQSACCGAGGGVWTAFPELAREIGRKRAAMARASGAEIIVTSCPWCAQNLSQFIEVKDLLDLVTESITRNA
ncbi:MAG: heterodisulfide reductase-related iron-sulfur binding cluster [Candidatus Geothermincolia bacterium]